jgi:hypothetical protein
MRSEKELWEVVLENKILFRTGLCLMIHNLWKFGSITHEERKVLLKAIYKKFEQHYMFKSGMWEPREKWIKARIKQLERQEKFNLTPAGYWVVASIVLLVVYIVSSLIYCIW